MSVKFSPETEKKIKEVISYYPQKQAALLSVLHLAQKEFGYINPEVEKLVAQILEMKPIRVREVVTFYSMFHQQPVGKYHLQVCSNISCSLLGAEKIIDYLSKKLGIGVGEITPDRKFTLSTVECLGACEYAPCMQINSEYYGNLTEQKIDLILDKLE
ncbi:MAG: NADH-quinone oxidoreductase subunit NuoE [Candidatus Aminicenantia bacterium]